MQPDTRPPPRHRRAPRLFDRPSASDGRAPGGGVDPRRAGGAGRAGAGRGGAGGRLDGAPARRCCRRPGCWRRSAGGAPAPLGLLAAAGIVDDVSGGPQVFRRLLPHRTTYNVVGEAGDPDAAGDARVRRPPRRRAGRPDLPARADAARRRHVPGVVREARRPRRRCCAWWRPGRRCAGALGGRPLRKLGPCISAGSLLAFGDIAHPHGRAGRQRQPHRRRGASSSSRGCCASSRSRACACCSSPPARRSRSWRACAAGCAATGPRSTASATRVVVLETLGSPELILLEGEGMIWMTDYDPGVRDFIADVGAATPASRCAAACGSASPPTRCRRCAAGCGRHARLLRRVQDARQLPLAARHPAQRRLRDGGARPCASPRRRSGEQRAREADRVLAGADLARVLRLLELAPAAGRAAGPGACPARARARRRARAAAAAPRARRASAGPSMSRASSRWAAIAGSALRPRVARRSATVKTVTSAA